MSLMRNRVLVAAGTRWKTGAIPIAIFLLALFWRVWNLSGESPWLDEVFTLPYLEIPSLFQAWKAASAQDMATLLAPFYFIVEYLWSALWGASPLSLRVLSLIFGMASIPLLYRLTRQYYGKSAAAIASLCLGFSLPHIFYSQEIRRYAFEMLLVLISFYSLLNSQNPESSSKAQRRHRYCFLFVSIVLPLVSLACVPLFVLQGLFLLYSQRRFSRFLFVWGTATFFSVLGVTLWTHTREIGRFFWMPDPTIKELLNTLLVFAGGRFSNDNPSPYLPFSVSVDYLQALVMYGLASYTLWCALKGKQRTTFLLLWLWLILPVLFWYILSLLWRSFFIYRYILFSIFPLYILTGAAYAALPSRCLKQACLALLLLCMTYQCTVRFHSPFRPAYEQAAIQIEKHDTLSNRPPIIVLKKLLNTVPFQYTAAFPESRIHSVYGLGSLHQRTQTLLQSTGAAWVLMWRWDRMGEFEDFLTQQQIDFSRYRLGGLPPLYLFYCEPRPLN